MDQQNTTSQSSESSEGQGPVGQGDYEVKQGECIESIAFDKGFFWETVWDDSQNAELKRVRKNPNAMLPGDKVFVPEKQEKEVSGATEQTHRFRKKGVPSFVDVVVRKFGEPRANTPYSLAVDGALFSGKTKADGRVRHPISPSAKEATLTVGEGEEAVEYTLQLGHLDPIEEISGVQGRLKNLGFMSGEPSGQADDATVEAIKLFQKDMGLEETGKLDSQTRDALDQENES